MTDPRRLRRKFVLAALAPLLILLSLPLKPQIILTFGAKVVLAARPVDPRDIFRGDYVALDFDVETLPLGLFDVPGGTPRDEAVRPGVQWCVELKEGEDGVWIAARAAKEPPRGPYLKGRVISAGHAGQIPGTAKMDYGAGLGRFYVREGSGSGLEEAGRKSALLATISLLGGEAAVVSLRPRAR